ncbi:Uncharacterised protein [Mycobacteroides abscessus subsp. abscessus]|nr:Uncharacterised protein [Mycobacteroides abscessus subsp. abscessus]SHV74129.1 Uncharacterised protein [Mycobacteroides abscessus subsp. abscessus]SIL26679.1 Uncharacterised protein [Mycobacteroides abscessus subsp. abscessus]SKI43844.1 Uncharacterised protein [Mycobacteroides abscessus subsp. abscessus]
MADDVVGPAGGGGAGLLGCGDERVEAFGRGGGRYRVFAPAGELTGRFDIEWVGAGGGGEGLVLVLSGACACDGLVVVLFGVSPSRGGLDDGGQIRAVGVGAVAHLRDLCVVVGDGGPVPGQVPALAHVCQFGGDGGVLGAQRVRSVQRGLKLHRGALVGRVDNAAGLGNGQGQLGCQSPPQGCGGQLVGQGALSRGCGDEGGDIGADLGGCREAGGQLRPVAVGADAVVELVDEGVELAGGRGGGAERSQGVAFEEFLDCLGAVGILLGP